MAENNDDGQKKIKPVKKSFRPGVFILKTLLFFLFCYGIYLLAAGVGFPYYFEKKLPELISEKTGRTVDIGETRFNPFSIRLEVDSFSMKEDVKASSVSHVFTSLQQIVVDFDPLQSLLSKSYHFKEISMIKPRLQFVQHSSGFNFDSIIDGLKTADTAEAQDSRKKDENFVLPQVYIQHFKLSDGNVHYADIRHDRILEYGNEEYFSLDAVDFMLKGENNRIQFILEGANGGSLDVDLALQLFPIKVVGDLKLQQIDLTRPARFYDHQIPANIVNGQLNFVSSFTVEEGEEGFAFSTENGVAELVNVDLQYEGNSFFSLKKLKIDGVGLASEKKSVELGMISVEGGQLGIKIDAQNKVDLVDYFSSEAGKSDEQQVEKSEKTEEEPWRVEFQGVQLSSWGVTLEESFIAPAQTHVFTPVKITLGPLSSELEESLDYSVDLTVDGQTALQSTGKIDLAKITGNQNVTMSDLDIPTLQPYVEKFVNMTCASGKAGFDGSLAFSTDPFQLQLTGDGAINNLLIKEKQEDKKLLELGSLQLQRLEYDSAENELVIHELIVDRPFTRFQIDVDGSTNMEGLTVQQENLESTAAEAAGKGNNDDKQDPFRFQINKVSVQKGQIDFLDKSIKPAFAASLTDFAGTVASLGSAKQEPAKVDLRGKLDKYAPVRLKGKINPFLEKPFIDLALLFNGIELTSLTPYSGTYVGYFIDRGQLDLNLDYQVKEGILKGGNSIVVKQLEFGKESNSDKATSLPVKLAIALLEDLNGVIDLDVNVQGDLNDPSVSVGGLVLKALTNIIMKAVSSPFSLIGNVLGGATSLDHISFSYGDFQIDESGRKVLDQVSDLLVKRPRLQLTVEGDVAVKDDGMAVAVTQMKQELVAAYPEAAGVEITVENLIKDENLAEALYELYEEKTDEDWDDVLDALEESYDEAIQDDDELLTEHLVKDMYKKMLNVYEPEQNVVQQLARQRMNAVKEYLVTEKGINAGRIFLLSSHENLSGKGAAVKLNLGVD